jgi:glutamate synthase (NADPH/NADH) small chain
MYRIVEKQDLTPAIRLMRVEAPAVARKALPGQFIILRLHERAERIPLTVADYDRDGGTITIIFQVVGKSTEELAMVAEGESILNFAGPLGRPSEIEHYGNVVCIGGGAGVAPIYPVARSLRQAGNRIASIIGARSTGLLFFEEEMRAVSHDLHIVTDDGSRGKRGLVTDALGEILGSGEKVDLVFAIGPVPMMRAVAELTRPHGIRTIASLNPVMVDGTGMCGSCRVSVGGASKFACVDGPDFDAHQVNFDELLARQRMYLREEQESREHHHSNYRCSCDDHSLGNARSGGERRSTEEAREPEDRPEAYEPKAREPMPVQDPWERIRNFDEVALGYAGSQAVSEAERCRQCKKKPCSSGCPVGVDIPAFIALIRDKDFLGAASKIRETNNLPAVCGRVCPQDEQCEKNCILGKKGEPVAIGCLERFVADYERQAGAAAGLAAQAGVAPAAAAPAVAAPTGKRVAVVGSGPSGLTAAADLARLGYGVTVFEALHEPGGVLVYGIPEFRLPKAVVREEIDNIKKLGAEVRVDSVIGKIASVDELLADGYSAVFVGTGAGLPNFMGIPGENLNGVYSANEFLTRTNLMKAYRFPDFDTPVRVGRRVAVIGGGNVAMDSARCALRLGAAEVHIVYRRSRNEMPARKEEIEHAIEEGVRLNLLCNAIRIIGNADGWVEALECIRFELGDPDESGRRSPVPIRGSEHIIPMDTVIMAIGNSPNPLISRTTPELQTGRRGVLVANENGATTKRGVFAGGDIITGAATVISAMGAGKRAAAAIDRYLRGDS